jgi:hypothetical protein
MWGVDIAQVDTHRRPLYCIGERTRLSKPGHSVILSIPIVLDGGITPGFNCDSTNTGRGGGKYD